MMPENHTVKLKSAIKPEVSHIAIKRCQSFIISPESHVTEVEPHSYPPEK